MAVARALILRNVKYSESDLIVHALLVEGGKQSFLARSALKSRKRFGGGILEPTHIVDLNFATTNKNTQLITLQDARLVEDFAGLRTSFDKLDLALRILHDVSKVGQEGDLHSAEIFNLLGHTFRALESTQRPELVETVFALKFLHQQGILDFQPWMRRYLAAPLREVVNQLEAPPSAGQSEAQPPTEQEEEALEEARLRLREYVLSAEAHFDSGSAGRGRGLTSELS